MIRSINFSISLRSSFVPSVKDISETLIFLLSVVDFPCDRLKWDEEVFFFVRSLKCMYKLTKSSLRVTKTPHNWPTVLDVAHYLAQYARQRTHASSRLASVDEANSMSSFTGKAIYTSFGRG
ncbi:unnamed protein product [Cochlearia groenlandica]